MKAAERLPTDVEAFSDLGNVEVWWMFGNGWATHGLGTYGH
jgi:hypothetical protein